MGSLETELEAVVSSSEGRECGIVEGGEGDKEGIARAQKICDARWQTNATRESKREPKNYATFMS